MRAVVQRVARAAVEVEGRTVGAIGPGLLVLAGLEAADTPADLEWTAAKLLDLRIFQDDAGKMNRSLRDLAEHAADPAPGLLLVPNFTLAGDARKGRRPSFDNAMPPDRARPEFAAFVQRLRDAAGPRLLVQAGEFGAHMLVSLVNDGPITLILDSRSRPGA